MTNLHTFFVDTVAAGWAPRNPCVDPAELATLEASLTRGDCISPLIQNGDTVYVDRAIKPEPGDVVSFRLGQRGADVQNMPPMPPGQVPGQWKKGDRWCKLLGVSHGFQMLLDRHGNSAAATLMACEDPDDVPELHPVRNVMRNGRLLFGPSAPTAPMIPRRGVLLGALGGLALAGCDFGGVNVPELPAVDETSGAQINLNAASVIGSILSAAASSLVATMPANSGVTLTQTQVSLAVTTSGFPIAVDAAANAFYSLASGVTMTLLNLQVLRDGSAVAGGEWDFTAGSTFTITGGGNSSAQQVTISCVDSPAAGSHTYSLLLTLRATGSAGGASATTSQNFLKVREIKR